MIYLLELLLDSGILYHEQGAYGKCTFFFFTFMYVCIYLFIYCFLGPHPWHIEGSQARGPIRATTAAGLRHSHSHSNTRSEPGLGPSPQLTARWDP